MPGGNVGNSFEMALKGDLVAFEVKAATRIYRGSFVAIDNTGYAVPAADVAGHVFVGLAEEEGNNLTGADGVVKVRVRRSGNAILIANNDTVPADVGKLAYAFIAHGDAADQRLHTTVGAGAVTNSVRIGRVLKRVPDVVGGAPTYGLKKLLVDISPGA